MLRCNLLPYLSVAICFHFSHIAEVPREKSCYCMAMTSEKSTDEILNVAQLLILTCLVNLARRLCALRSSLLSDTRCRLMASLTGT